MKKASKSETVRNIDDLSLPLNAEGSSSTAKTVNRIFFAFGIAAISVYLSTIDQLTSPVKTLLLLGSSFSARTVCSGIFVSNRTLQSLQYDLLANGKILGLFPPVMKDSPQEKSVTSSLLGLGFLPVTARYRGPYHGCYLVDSTGKLPRLEDYPAASLDPAATEIPLTTNLNPHLQEFLSYDFSEAALMTNQTRAIVVLHKGVVVGEGYQERGGLAINATTRLLGWSMTKTIHALMVAAAMGAGGPLEGLTLDTPIRLDALDPAHHAQLLSINHGKPITYADLLGMADILSMAEKYTIDGDVIKMLSSQGDLSAFAARAGRRQVRGVPSPLLANASVHPSPSNHFHWYYSSGLSNVLAGAFRNLFPSTEAYYKFAFENFFGKIGKSFTFETDSAGTFVASSYVYATARDFARIGLLILQQQKDFPSSTQAATFNQFLSRMHIPHPTSGGHYSSVGSVWLNPSRASVKEYNMLPADSDHKTRFRWMTQVLPSDCLILQGYLGQFVAVCPSLELVVVRLGLTKGNMDTFTASDVENMETSAYSKSRLFLGILERLGLGAAGEAKPIS